MENLQHFMAPLAVFIAGAVGGIVSAAMSDSGTIELPGRGASDGAGKVYRLGWIGNAAIGGVAAVASWGIYGTASSKSIAATGPADCTWAAFGAAILIGVSGSRWLSAEVDKTILRKTAEVAAGKPADPDLVATISMGTPSQALQAAVAR